MQYQFSDRISALKPSLIREILKNSSDPNVIAFSAGNPSPDAFPTAEIQSISAEILSTNPVGALQYSVTEGYPALREACKALVTERYQINMENQELLITSGAQQGVDLICKVLLNEGDTVICENPSFIGSLNCFRSYHCNLVGVPMQPDGIDLAQLEQTIKEKPHAKLLYLIPNFQNPTGYTTSREKRVEILRIAKQYNLFILEDNPYGDLRYSGEAIESLKSMDTEGRVLYVGSFSKILSPGMRIGFTVAPSEIIAKMTVGKQCADVHSNILSQMICAEWMRRYDINAHIEKIRALYSKKLALILDAMKSEFHPDVTYNQPEGGLFLWCTLPDGANMLDFCAEGARRMVTVVPGSAFYVDDSAPCQSFRVNFSNPREADIAAGIERLGQLTKEFI